MKSNSMPVRPAILAAAVSIAAHGLCAQATSPAAVAERLACRTAYTDTTASRADTARRSSLSGADCYRALLKQVAGVDISTDSMYDEAVRQRLKLVDRIRVAGAALFGEQLPAIEVLRRVRGDPQFVLNGPDSVMAAYSTELARARAAIPPLFFPTPDAPLDVRAIPEAQAAYSAPAAYTPSQNGNRATFLVNAYQPGGIAKMNVMMGIVHEAYPGHHFQKLYADANHTNGNANFVNIGFVEGWGIYAEQLGDEVGLYTTPLDRIGYLTHLFDVFMALQIDIGMHARGWTHAQAVDTMLAVSGRPHVQAVQYANRHVTTPGQLASYGIGFLAIKLGRESAEAALGPKFNLQEFHDAVLRYGAVTLPQLRENIDRWVATRAKAGADGGH